MTNEQKKNLLSEAAFISMDDSWYRMDYCTDVNEEGIFYYSDEETGEQYVMEYDELDLTRPDVLLYKLQLIQV